MIAIWKQGIYSYLPLAQWRAEHKSQTLTDLERKETLQSFIGKPDWIIIIKSPKMQKVSRE
jgi:hypothetical protein